MMHYNPAVFRRDLHASMDVQVEYLKRYPDGYPQQVEAKLARELAEQGKTHGVVIRPASVFVRRTEDIARRDIVTFDAIWSPDPQLGVLLEGGPADGMVVRLAREDHGRPHHSISVNAGGPTKGHLTSIVSALYSRDGIHRSEGVWVYRYRPEPPPVDRDTPQLRGGHSF